MFSPIDVKAMESWTDRSWLGTDIKAMTKAGRACSLDPRIIRGWMKVLYRSYMKVMESWTDRSWLGTGLKDMAETGRACSMGTQMKRG